MASQPVELGEEPGAKLCGETGVAEQPLKIIGSRALTDSEIERINRVKAAEKVLLDVQAEVAMTLAREHESKKAAAVRVFRRHNNNSEQAELDRFVGADPHWWAAKGRRDIQIGVMALVRAIEQPE